MQRSVPVAYQTLISLSWRIIQVLNFSSETELFGAGSNIEKLQLQLLYLTFEHFLFKTILIKNIFTSV